MLDGTRDAAGDVELRRHLAGLADPPVVWRVAGIDSGTACTNGGTELVGDRQDDLPERLGRAERTATGYDELCRRQLRAVGS